MKFRKFRRFLHGDTLVEVTLAIGIFSMVAVAVVAVVSGSTSSAQSALETTVTREQIDIQAEALRFIQASYIAGGKTNASGNELYAALWVAIASRALSASDFDKSNFLEYNPNTCSELYEKNDFGRDTIMLQNGFVINTHAMALLNANYNASTVNNIIDRILVGANGSNFKVAGTYPRIVYAENTYDESAGGESIYEQDQGSNIQAVEGLYVVAVKDNQSSTVVNDPDTISTGINYKAAAYYDFYIRTCWYGPGADHPSTISTVIRLQDPDVIEY